MSEFQTAFETAENSPGFLLWKVSNLHQRLQRRELATLDLTPTQFSVLACFAHLSKAGSPSQSDVCAFAALDKMIVSDATRALLDKGFVLKTPSDTDKRMSTIKLTRSGRATCNQATKIVEALDASLFAPAIRRQPLIQQLQAILAANDSSGT